MTPEQYCRTKAAPAGSNLYYAALRHDAQDQRRLFALFALYYELSAVIYRSSDPDAARTTLYWWFEEAGRMRAGEAGHPVTREIAQLDIQDFLSAEGIMACVAGMGQFLDGAQGADCQAWLKLHGPTAGHIWETAGRLCGCADPRQLTALTNAGCCHGAFEQLHYLRRGANLGIHPIPAEPAARHGVAPHLSARDQSEANLKNLLDELFAYLYEQTQVSGMALQTGSGGRLLFAVILLRLTGVLCRKYRADATPITRGHISLTPIRKLWIAWRAARRMDA